MNPHGSHRARITTDTIKQYQRKNLDSLKMEAVDVLVDHLLTIEQSELDEKWDRGRKENGDFHPENIQCPTEIRNELLYVLNYLTIQILKEL